MVIKEKNIRKNIQLFFQEDIVVRHNSTLIIGERFEW